MKKSNIVVLIFGLGSLLIGSLVANVVLYSQANYPPTIDPIDPHVVQAKPVSEDIRQWLVAKFAAGFDTEAHSVGPTVTGVVLGEDGIYDVTLNTVGHDGKPEIGHVKVSLTFVDPPRPCRPDQPDYDVCHRRFMQSLIENPLSAKMEVVASDYQPAPNSPWLSRNPETSVEIPEK